MPHDPEPILDFDATAAPADPMTVDDPRIAQLAGLAQLMDSQFQIPGTKIRIGLDAIIGLIPGIGDTLSLLIAAFFIAQGPRFKLRKRDYVKMSFNVFIDWLIGLVPLIGDIFDIGWKGNIRNIEILRRAADRSSKIIDA